MSLIDDLAAFVSSASASDLPERDREILRRHLTDVVAARLVGGACSEGKAVAAFYPPGQGADSIAGLAALVRLTETDDIHTPSGTTPSSVAVPVALGLAADAPCSAERLESAIFVGTELVVRLGLAIGGAGVLYRGLWPTRCGATLGAAAAACRVWGVSQAQTKNALSLAMLMTCGRAGRFAAEPSGRWIIFATSVADGIRAASAARAGFVSDPTVFDPGWLERAFGGPVDVEGLSRDLGRTSVFPGLSLKPYCTSRQALPGAEAMRALVARGLDPASILSFKIHVPTAYAPMISQKLDAANHSSTYVSGAGLAAIAALAPDALYDVDRAGVMHNSRIVELAARGSVAADPALDHHYPARWPARLEIETPSGDLHYEVIEPLGAPGNPMNDAQLNKKVRKVLGQSRRSDAVGPLLELTQGAFGSDAAATSLARFFRDGLTA